ncbi:hypothetical protein NW753_010624 [Fusarium oxysporum]|nr:hypothetical protein NW753_010624 [Fusarium oxysporum]
MSVPELMVGRNQDAVIVEVKSCSATAAASGCSKCVSWRRTINDGFHRGPFWDGQVAIQRAILVKSEGPYE